MKFKTILLLCGFNLVTSTLVSEKSQAGLKEAKNQPYEVQGSKFFHKYHKSLLN